MKVTLRQELEAFQWDYNDEKDTTVNCLHKLGFQVSLTAPERGELRARLVMRYPGGTVFIKHTDWVVIYSNLDVRIVSDKAFHKQYKEV